MLHVLLPLSLLSLLVLLFRHLAQPPRKGARLPTHRLSQPRATSGGWKLERHGLTVSLSTTALNTLPRSILLALPAASQTRLRRLYDAFAWAGAVGGGAALGAAVWAAGQVWWTVWLEMKLHAGATSQHVAGMRRATEPPVTAPPATGSGGLQPLIPGVTTPLSDLPTLLLALVINQLIHELGHALSAALDDIHPSKLSFSLHAFLPSASVSFPSSTDYMTAKAKTRLAAAGAGHNLTLFLLLWLIGFSGLGRIFWYDRSEAGRVVQTVSPGSPLYGHLFPGDLITHVDDMPIGGRADLWDEYLMGDRLADAGQGWCVSRAEFIASPPLPCSTAEGTVAFVALDSRDFSEPRCRSPHPLLETPSTRCLCDGATSICIRPADEERILRIRLDTGRVVLWSGERSAVLHSVPVSKLDGRVWPALIRWVQLYVQYVSSIAISLFFFNLLPLPSTDGSHLLRALLSLRQPILQARQWRAAISRPQAHPTINIYREYELDSDSEADSERGGDYEGGSMRERSREEVWKRRLRRSVEGVSTALVAIWAAGWAMVALLRSS